MNKVVLVAFLGEPMCFVHVLLNALDMKDKGFDVKIIIEGSACKLVKTLDEPGAAFGDLYRKVRDANLIDCVCRACASKMEAAEAAQSQGLRLEGEMSGHPSLARYIADGYQIITF
ncbi:MAG: DsrE family protein [Sedimentisphaerales bacterium]|nr:DsrE family protein [Sedimentisphaerales bacterium]